MNHKFLVVELPRAEAPKWWGLNWADVIAAVESGAIPNAAAREESKFQTPRAPKDFAWLRENDGRAFLLSQGWDGEL